ncbi:MAG: ATP-grasp domain-containing protein [Candidatus Nanopelagicales bacterium]
MSTSSSPREPRVVIVDVDRFDNFRELASVLRRRGIDVVHLRPAYVSAGRAARVLDRLAGPTEILQGPIGSPAADRQIGRLLAAPTVDVHAPEPVLAVLADLPQWRANAVLAAKTAPDRPLPLACDKYAVGQAAAAAGVAVPGATLDLAAPTAFPVVVKGRLGSGGSQVRIADSPEALARSVEELGGPAAGLYLEDFHGGTSLGTAGVARGGEVVTAVAYERADSAGDPLGPPVGVAIIDDRRCIEAARLLVEDLGYTGIFCLNFVRDDDGAPLLIDVNLRVFGTWLSHQEMGVPLIESYLYVLGAGPPPPPSRAVAGTARAATRLGGFRAGARPALQDAATSSGLVWSRIHRLGPGTTLASQLRVAQAALRAARRR